MNTQETSAIALLLQQMDDAPGFAGLSSSVEMISTLGDGDGGSQQICAAILRDAALTAKLLRIANSARNARTARNISTIDQVLALLGLNTVRSVAMSLALLDNLSNTPQSKILHAEIVTSYFCGSLDFEVTRQYGTRFNAQEAQICGLMQNLARMMAIYFQYGQIEQCKMLQAEANLSEEDAVKKVFGMSFSEIGANILRHWNLPEIIENSLLPAASNSSIVVASASGWHQHCSAFCRRITDALFRMPENSERIEIAQCIELYSTALNLKEDRVTALIHKCLADTEAMLAALSFPCDVTQARNLLRRSTERVQDRISSGDRLARQSDITEGRPPIEVIQQVLHMMHTRCSFDRTLLCVADSSGSLKAIAGVGRNASVVTSRFRCQGPKPDLFRAVVARRQDAYIADLHQPSYAKLLPPWYLEVVNARSVMLMPLVHGDKLLGVVYADFVDLHEHAPTEAGQEEVQNWRSQLVQALLAGSVRSNVF